LPANSTTGFWIAPCWSEQTNTPISGTSGRSSKRGDSMAVMWPRQLPSWIVSDSRRAAERHVFAKLRDVLGNDWAVFYSRPWWGIARGGGEVDGEADFIVVHPDFGLLFLEVKGGGISFNP